MFCKNCGTSHTDNSVFCSNCGKPVNDKTMKTEEQPKTNKHIPGKNYIKVTSIIALCMLGLGLLIGLVDPEFMLDRNDEPVFYTLFSYVNTIIALYGFIIGILYCTNLEKSRHLLLVGRTMLSFFIADFLFNRVLFNGEDAFVTLLLVLLPLFYTIGATKNKKALET